MRTKEKTDITPGKSAWHPSPLIGQVVLVTTCNDDGTSNVAPKSWISMMASDPSVLAIGCNVEHWTARNILSNREFVVNVPGAELVETVWTSHHLPHPRPVEAAGLTPLPSRKVKPPRIEECKAHLECALDHHLTFGQEGDEHVAEDALVIPQIHYAGVQRALECDKRLLNVRDALQLF